MKITDEDIEAVINRIRYGGEDVDAPLQAIEYLGYARGWRKKAEKWDEFLTWYQNKPMYEAQKKLEAIKKILDGE